MKHRPYIFDKMVLGREHIEKNHTFATVFGKVGFASK